MSDKAKKTDVLYVSANPDKIQKCGNCALYIKGNKTCLIHPATIKVIPKTVEGKKYVPVCGYYNYGPSNIKSATPTGSLTAEQSGLVWVRKGTRCGTCEYFEAPNGCIKVEGVIDPDGCCAAWENDSKTLSEDSN